jgi:cytochrome c oxidase subunit III
MTSATAHEHEQEPFTLVEEPLDHGSGQHDVHNPRLAHHFEDMEQQFAAGKLGIWLFLITEILFFSGLFVAYAVYRSTHPEVFAYAHQFLDKSLGALNTVVLIFSSLTMAWAVRAAQLGQRRSLVGLLATTLACASFFLGVKAVEYSHKWDEGILWGASYRSQSHHSPTLERLAAVGNLSGDDRPPGEGHDHDESELSDHGHYASVALRTLSIPAAFSFVLTLALTAFGFGTGRQIWGVIGLCLVASSVSYFLGVGAGQTLPGLVSQFASVGEETKARSGVEHSAHTERGDASMETSAGHAATDAIGLEVSEFASDALSVEPAGVGVFFSIYYVMTGLHAIHILAGMGVIAWLLVNAAGGLYGPNYFGPVDYVGLYWHLVDLVWIYLFPLLYLIH